MKKPEKTTGSCSVAILMCTYNGEEFLSAQLESFSNQNFHDWSLHVSDDGSTDRTVQLIEEFSKNKKNHIVSIRTGPCSGYSRNFISILCQSDIEGDYFAIADQDDVWFPDKISRAVEVLNSVPDGVPAIYGGRTVLVRGDLSIMGCSPLFRKRPDLRNALVQTFAGGNTMVMNQEARRLLIKAGSNIDVYAHDWWFSLVISACGGRLIYDPEPCLYYRQHEGNQLGHNTSLHGKFLRFKKMLSGDFQFWINKNLKAIGSLEQEIPLKNWQLLEDFSCWRNQSFLLRLRGMARTALFRQGFSGQLALWLAVVMKKI